MKQLLSALACAVVFAVVATPPAWPADQTIGERVDDAKITTAIKTKLTTERVKNLVKVHVDTQNGVVHLEGKVPTADDKAEAERLARRTKGVRDVVNNLRIEEGSASASPRR